MYVQSSLEATQIEDHHAGDESLWLNIKLQQNDQLLFGCCYRSPNSVETNNQNINELLLSMSSQRYSHVLVCGDFNYPAIDWTLHSTTRATPSGSAFLEAIDNSFLYQHVRGHTRARGSADPTTLDLVFTNEESMITDLSYESPLGKVITVFCGSTSCATAT